MRVALLVASLLVVVGASTALVLMQDDPQPAAAEAGTLQWYPSLGIAAPGHSCGHCHYGMSEFWDADWEQDGTQWTLRLAPRYSEVPLHAVQVADAEDALVLWHSEVWSFDWREGQTWTRGFDVPHNATHVFAHLHGIGPQDAALGQTRNHANHADTALVLVAPDGTRHDIVGPESDLKMGTVEAVPGTWRLEATLMGGDAPLMTGRAWVEALGGPVEPRLDYGDNRTWTFEGNATGAPPDVWVRLQPHFDHEPYEHNDWDAYDSVPFWLHYAPEVGPPPPPRTWNQTEIDAIWGDQTEHVFVDRRGHVRGAYIDEPDEHNDPGLGGSYPGFGPLGKPVWPGTGTVRFELTWGSGTDIDLPVDQPIPFGVRYSPAHWIYFHEAKEVHREPGRAVFEASVNPRWWEAPDQRAPWDPDLNVGFWDVAPFIQQDGEAHVHDASWRLRAVAVRG